MKQLMIFRSGACHQTGARISSVLVKMAAFAVLSCAVLLTPVWAVDGSLTLVRACESLPLRHAAVRVPSARGTNRN